MSDVLSAVSILIVFGTVFLDLVSRRVDSIVGQRRPSSQEHNARTALVREFRKTLFAMALPLSMGLFVLAYLLLPTSILVVRESSISLWNFDILSTLFLAVHAGVIVLFFLSLALLVRLLRRFREVMRP